MKLCAGAFRVTGPFLETLAAHAVGGTTHIGAFAHEAGLTEGAIFRWEDVVIGTTKGHLASFTGAVPFKALKRHALAGTSTEFADDAIIVVFTGQADSISEVTHQTIGAGRSCSAEWRGTHAGSVDTEATFAAVVVHQAFGALPRA